MQTYSKRQLICDRAKKLRRDSNKPEKIVWSWLKARRMNDLKFRRQFPVLNFILDFYCEQLQIAIEMDGDYHNAPQQKRYDLYRTRRLDSIGIQVIRITARDVLRNSYNTKTKLSNDLKKLL